MPRLRTAERALTLLASSTTPSQNYVCHTCRLQAARRNLHTTSPVYAEVSFLTRIRRSVFGTAESKEVDRKREEARQKRVEELSNQSEEERAAGGGFITDSKGREFEIAPLVDESVNKEYVPATSWEGLERIGSEAWVRQRADGGEVYLGFAPRQKMMLDDEGWKRLLYRVVGEVQSPQAYPEPAKDVEEDSPEPALEGTSETFEDVVGAAEGKVLESPFGIVPDNDDWMQTSLSDPSLKFAILKRTTQLSGHRPLDAAVSSARTVGDLYTALKTREKPKKLGKSKQMHQLGADNPNVTVHGRRQTPIDKHREVGRWKIIEDELKQRDLPVTGTRWPGAKTIVGVEPENKSKKAMRKARKNA